MVFFLGGVVLAGGCLYSFLFCFVGFCCFVFISYPFLSFLLFPFSFSFCFCCCYCCLTMINHFTVVIYKFLVQLNWTESLMLS